ncbi:unnamed protein product [Notodromas monacha]|uniref:Uncharacterized protein n=1 Tax=Notodromas monacha TaxID=399045 RepID=A0A7R9BXH6_9CRUS|nr:unnamed protein product [Notodromas monacha]CAG0923598.1 unnamed protein product [Notodromas monacha]
MPEEFWKKFPRKDALHLEKSGSQRRSEVEEQLLAWGFRIEAMFSDGYAADDTMCDDERRIWSDSSYSLLYKTAVKLLPDEQLVHSEIIFLCRKTNRKELQQHQQLPNKVPCSEVKSLGDSFSAIMTTETAEESSTQKEPVAPSTGKTPDECSETAADAETKQEQQPASSATAEEVIIPRTEAADLINVQHYHVNFVFTSFLSLGKGLHKQHLLPAKRADLELSSWCSQSNIVVQEAGKTGLGNEGEKHHVAPSPVTSETLRRAAFNSNHLTTPILDSYYRFPVSSIQSLLTEVGLMGGIKQAYKIWKKLIICGFREEPFVAVNPDVSRSDPSSSPVMRSDGWISGIPNFAGFPTLRWFFHNDLDCIRKFVHVYLVRHPGDINKERLLEMQVIRKVGIPAPAAASSPAINSEASQATSKQEESGTAPSTRESPQALEPSQMGAITAAELRQGDSQPMGPICFSACTFSTPGTYVFKIQK